jgi:hypothetical protein
VISAILCEGTKESRPLPPETPRATRTRDFASRSDFASKIEGIEAALQLLRVDDFFSRHDFGTIESNNFITEAVRRDSYPDFNGKRPGPSITLSTIFKCTAVNVPLRCCISSTMRARHSLSHVSAALFFMLSFSAALRNCFHTLQGACERPRGQGLNACPQAPGHLSEALVHCFPALTAFGRRSAGKYRRPGANQGPRSAVSGNGTRGNNGAPMRATAATSIAP